jgi:hypothetical protein
MKLILSTLALSVAVFVSPAVQAQIVIDGGFGTNGPIASPWFNTGTTPFSVVGGKAEVFTPTFSSPATLVQNIIVPAAPFYNVSFDWRNVSSSTSTFTARLVGGPTFLTSTSGGGPFSGTFSGLTSGILEFSWTGGSGPTFLTLDDVSIQDVPGPLPILGALAAFGWTRNLRRKIRQADLTTTPSGAAA